MKNDGVFEVGQLNEYVRTLIASDDVLASLAVRGELSNYKIYPSGHHYFTMKDSVGALRCVMFRGSAEKLRFKPENGMKVTAFGRVEVYVRDGAYQFYASAMTPDGIGDLYAEYERLKEKLRLEGLFDAAHKKPIPKMPRTIAVITSGAGAAVRDIIRVLGARWPLTKVKLLPVRVQGVEAPPEIAGAIKYCNRYNLAELIITGRGGGSIEDLWAFNDERVARAIYESEIPVISAVGHEPDVTISDFVADLRAATPSNAAELAVPDMADIRAGLSHMNARLAQSGGNTIKHLRRRLETAAGSRVMRSPGSYIDDRRLALDRAGERAASAIRRRVSDSGARFSRAAASLDALSPIKVLGRGYAIARGADGAIIRCAADVSPGDELTLRLREDEISCTVNRT
ncbi:MAG: exodeoxyribonuclease VII large subunit [Oscillospiraceae bacterium]|jgi:exodeoxyribonuclease VII large subunit|nr:exodeoxyribonuclease VII large subunit [Oscillospiraceae bacterium]